MDQQKIDKIRKLLAAPHVDEEKLNRAIIEYIADHEAAIGMILAILEAERKDKQAMITEMNLNLTRNTTYLLFDTMESKKNFFLEETKAFYRKWKHKIQTAGLNLWQDL